MQTKNNIIAIQKKNRVLGNLKKDIFMYNLRGELIEQFTKQIEAAMYLNKTEASISNYIKKENRFDGIHFLCRR